MTGRTASHRAGILRRPAEFEAVLRTGLRVATANFVGRAVANTTAHPRLGMIAGKKAAPRAVDRNRAKRLVREIFRVTSPAIGAFDVTIQLRNDLRSHDNTAVRAELQQLLDTLARRCGAKSASQPRAPAGSSPRPSSDRQ